jgi:hypothetical protein
MILSLSNNPVTVNLIITRTFTSFSPYFSVSPDLDWKFTYSNVIAFVISNDNLHLMKVYPGAFSKDVTTQISTPDPRSGR